MAMTSQHTSTTTTHNHDHQQHHQDDASHIFSVAAKNLQDCVELLQSVQAAIIEEQEQEQEALAGVNGSNHDDTNNDNTPGSNGSRLTNSFQPSKANNATSRINAVDIHHMSRTASQGSEESTTTTLREGDENEGSVPKESKVTPSTTSSSLSQHQQRHQRTQGSTTKCHLPPPAQICITPCKKSEIYTRPSTLACNGTIGKHVRHLHDHYRLLLTTYPKNQEAAGQWRVDYDARSREVPMETNIDVAIEELEKIQFMLEDYRDTLNTDHHQQHDQQPQERFDLLQPVTLQATIDPARAPVRFQSTFGRELWFCSLHAVHHFAMIKVICGEYGMSLMEGFGLAPSTVQHRLAK